MKTGRDQALLVGILAAVPLAAAAALPLAQVLRSLIRQWTG